MNFIVQSFPGGTNGIHFRQRVTRNKETYLKK